MEADPKTQAPCAVSHCSVLGMPLNSQNVVRAGVQILASAAQCSTRRILAQTGSYLADTHVLYVRLSASMWTFGEYTIMFRNAQSTR